MPITGSTTPSRKNGIPYQIMIEPGSIRAQYGQTTSGTTVVAVVAAAYWELFREEMLGWTDTPGGKLVLVLPEKCVYDDSQYCLQCDLIAAVAPHPDLPGPFAGPGYDLAHVQLQFAAPLYEVKEDGTAANEWERNTVWTVRGAANNEKIPGGGFKFVDAAKTPLPEVGVKTGRLIHLTAKWLDVPTPPYGHIVEASNKVNDAPLDWKGGSYPASTVLFESWSEDVRRNPLGELTSDLTYNFAIRADGRTWNKFWKSGAAGYVEVTSDGTVGGNPVFDTYDFTQLFRVP